MEVVHFVFTLLPTQAEHAYEWFSNQEDRHDKTQMGSSCLVRDYRPWPPGDGANTNAGFTRVAWVY